MSNDKVNKIVEVLDLIYADIIPKEILKKMGISEEEYNLIVKTYVPNSQPYFRIFSKEDRDVLTPEAYGYLYHLLLMRSINRDLFEKIIYLAFHLSETVQQKVNKKMVDDIINFVMFSGQDEVSIDDLMNFCLTENRIL